MIKAISCGGNYLLNIGPRHDGTIPPIFEERLRNIGKWLKTNGEAIYYSSPWSFQSDSINKNVWYTKNRTMDEVNQTTTIYATFLDWPDSSIVNLGAPQPSEATKVYLLGYESEFEWAVPMNSVIGMQVHLPYIPVNKMPSLDAWVLKITGILN